MNIERDLVPALRTWLHEDAHEFGDRVLDSVLDQLDSTPQSSALWLIRRFQMNNNLVRWGLVAAVVVVIVVVAINLLPGSPQPGGEPSATPEPSVAESSAAEPTPAPSDAAGLPVGSTHVLYEDDVLIEVTIPADGWNGEEGILLKNDNVDPPDGAGMIVFSGPLLVYGDACHWSTTRPDTPVTTVDELIAALAAQTPREASEPVDVTLDEGEFSARAISLSVPEDAAYSGGEFTDCDQGYFGSWTLPDAPPSEGPHRYHQGPGQIDEVYVIDVAGVLTVIDTAYYAGTPDAVVDELRGIVESATFHLPGGGGF